MSFLRIRRGGFTLVELMVVIAIITVLIAIGLPVMTRVREKARQTACIANLLQIQQSLRLYRLEEGGYPGPYDPVTGQGGLNALYPTYVPSRKAFICPDDSTEDGQTYAALPMFQATGYDPKDETKKLLTLIYIADQMYQNDKPPGFRIVPDPVWGQVKCTGYDWMDPTFFMENYSSYNLMYNWIGYAWWDKEKYGLKGKYLKLLTDTTSGNSDRDIRWSDNLAFWYRWFYWDPEDEYGLRSNPLHGKNRSFVNDSLPYFLGQQFYWMLYPDPAVQVYPSRTKDATLGSIVYPLQDNLKRDLWVGVPPDEYNLTAIDAGIPSGVFPGLINHNAPENTIITRCPWHRLYSKSADIALRLDGTVDIIPGPEHRDYNWAIQPRLTP